MRSLALLTPAATARSSLEQVRIPDSARAVRARRYTGRRATVASGMTRAVSLELRVVTAPLSSHTHGGCGEIRVGVCERENKIRARG
ncbi:hypothetical protein GCM10022242_16860 [Nocardioides panacisoli]|uniref:Uncharacterized protein n=1 Tax=Nocardioides panacisoli TaxID=627624 RepID=A0ABP7ID88_9ACTN